MAKRKRVTFSVMLDFDGLEEDKILQSYMFSEFNRFCNLIAGELLIEDRNPKVFSSDMIIKDKGQS